ncbi:retrotransposon protein, putative, ty3-gypsy subclass [Tanacetum coccineum]
MTVQGSNLNRYRLYLLYDMNLTSRHGNMNSGDGRDQRNRGQQSLIYTPGSPSSPGTTLRFILTLFATHWTYTLPEKCRRATVPPIEFKRVEDHLHDRSVGSEFIRPVLRHGFQPFCLSRRSGRSQEIMYRLPEIKQDHSFLRVKEQDISKTAFPRQLLYGLMNSWLCPFGLIRMLQLNLMDLMNRVFHEFLGQVRHQGITKDPRSLLPQIRRGFFSRLALPLTKLMRKGEKFVWNEEREKSFEELKQRLVSAPILTLPSGSGGFQIYSDASKKGLGCVLMQHGKVIAYASRQLKPYEVNYPTHDLELAAVTEGVLEVIGKIMTPTSYIRLKQMWMADALSNESVMKAVSKWKKGLFVTLSVWISNSEYDYKSRAIIQNIDQADRVCVDDDRHFMHEIPVWKWNEISMDFVTGYNGLRGRHDAILAIVSERDPRFTSRFWKGLQKASGNQLKFSTELLHRDRQNSRQRTNQTLDDMLRSCAF